MFQPARRLRKRSPNQSRHPNRSPCCAKIGLFDLGVQEYNLELGKRLGLGKDELYLLGVGSRAARAAQQRLHARQH